MEISEILEISPLPLPFDANDKIFLCTDEEGEIIGESYSYNDWIEKIKNIARINEDLIGSKNNVV
jgi:hypothetical protein